MMYFEWDPAKADVNFRKHGVTFEDAATIFDDLDADCVKERTVDGEQRWQTFGKFDGLQLLVVAHTLKHFNEDEYVRIISARRANKAERKRYESQIKRQ